MRAMQEFRIDSLSCFRGGRLVFDGVSFSVKAGEALIIKGPNGAGKSSLLRVLAGLIDPIAGAMYRDGVDIRHDIADHRAATYYFAHADAVNPSLTVDEDLSFWAAINGAEAFKGDHAAAVLDLTAQRGLPGRYLSSGQRRRTALARLTTSNADLWLLDEPSVGLDAASVDLLAQMIADHREGGGCVIAVTHTDLKLQDASTLDISPFAVSPDLDPALQGRGGLG